MRHRRWVVVLAVLIIAVLPLSFIGLRIASRHPSVKREVLSRLVPRTEGRLSIGELEIGLASLRLGNVTVEIGDVAVVSVPEASVSVSYKRLLTSGFELRRALSTVIVNDPHVSITYGRTAPAERAERPIDLVALVDVLPSYLGVSGGTLVLEDAATGRSVRVDSIALLLERVDEDRIEGSAMGGGFGGARNVRSELVWDAGPGTAEITVDLADADFEQGLTLPGALPVDVTAGRATASLALSGNVAGDDRILLTYSVEDGRVVLPGEFGVLDRVSITGSYDGSRAAFAVEPGRWHGASVRGEGAIDTGDRAFDALEITGRAVPLDRLAEAVGAGPTGVSGLVDFAAVIEGPVDEPRLTATARAESVQIAGVTLSALRARGAYAGDLVEVHWFTARALGGAVEGFGEATIGRGDTPWLLDIRCDAEGVAAAAVSEFLGGPQARGDLTLTSVVIRGTNERPELEALVRWSGAGVGPVNLGTGAGGVLLRDGTLSATAVSRDTSYTATAEVASFFSDPVIDADVTLYALAADSLLDLRGGPTIPLLLDGDVGIAGPADALDVTGTLAARGEAFTATLGLEGSLTAGAAGTVLRLAVDSDDATMKGVVLPFSSSIEIDRSELVVSPLNVAGVARAHLRVGLGADHPLEGSLVVSEAELADVLGAATGIASEGARGLVFASGSVTGSLDRPEATLQLQVGNGRLAGVRGLDGALLAALDGRRIDVRELTIRETGRPFITASGDVDLDGEMALSVHGDGIPGPLLGGGVDSRFDLTLGLGGRTESPTLDARIESSDGTFLRIPYDEFVARVTGAEGVLRVEPLALERSGSYRLSASARVPYEALSEEGEEEGSLSFEVDGDPLAFLAELTPLVESARGSGHLTFHLVGGRRDVTLVSAELEARASTVAPSVLFDELRDVETSIVISDGAVREGSVRAVVDGSAIALRSTRDAVPIGREGAPLTIGGVDVGVLALSNDADGVRTTIPGLMLPEDVGRVAVRGKDGAPELLMFGPVARPLLWGELEFSDMTFTYPFADSDADVMGGFLSDAEWSMRIAAGRNVWYWRPDANLRLDAGGALDFAGVPSDGGLCVSGRIESSKGSITYLDTDFDAEKVFVDFPLFCEPPRFYVEASTRVEDGTTVTLTMDAFERALAFTARGATIDESALTLSSDSPDDNTEEKIVSKLTYGVSYDLLEEEEEATLGRRRAIEVIGRQLSGRVVRPLLSPIEGRLKRNLNLDLVRFEVDFVEHFLAQLDQWSAQEDGGEYQPFLADTRVTLGKYISRDWLLSYIGIAEAFEEEIGLQQLGLRHELGIEYEVSRNTSISLRTVYDPSLAGWDRRISIENRYDF